MESEKLSGKVALGLERLSEAYRHLLGLEAAKTGLSPIQIRILIFISYHSETLCTVTDIAHEFNLTKPTISDAVKTLETKNLVHKTPSTRDSRSFQIAITQMGKQLISQAQNYYAPITSLIEQLPDRDLESLYAIITNLIYRLHQEGALKVQRTCFACKYYDKREGHFCQLLNMHIKSSDIRLDCPEFKPAV